MEGRKAVLEQWKKDSLKEVSDRWSSFLSMQKDRRQKANRLKTWMKCLEAEEREYLKEKRRAKAAERHVQKQQAYQKAESELQYWMQQQEAVKKDKQAAVTSCLQDKMFMEALQRCCSMVTKRACGSLVFTFQELDPSNPKLRFCLEVINENDVIRVLNSSPKLEDQESLQMQLNSARTFKQFLTLARQAWKPSPEAVLLQACDAGTANRV